MRTHDLERVARLVGVYRSTVDAMPHPVDDFDRWRHRWQQLMGLAAQVNALLQDAETPPDR
jgi:hypothetical protein